MSRATPASILDALNWRYAVKQFDPTRKIDPSVWADLEKSLALTPSSFGLQPWQFLIVDNPDIRAQLVPHSWHQRQVADASHLVIMTVRTSIDAAYINRYLDDVAATRHTTGRRTHSLALPRHHDRPTIAPSAARRSPSVRPAPLSNASIRHNPANSSTRPGSRNCSASTRFVPSSPVPSSHAPAVSPNSPSVFVFIIS